MTLIRDVWRENQELVLGSVPTASLCGPVHNTPLAASAPGGAAPLDTEPSSQLSTTLTGACTRSSLKLPLPSTAVSTAGGRGGKHSFISFKPHTQAGLQGISRLSMTYFSSFQPLFHFHCHNLISSPVILLILLSKFMEDSLTLVSIMPPRQFFTLVMELSF